MLKAASGSYKVHKHNPHKRKNPHTHIFLSCCLSNPVASSRVQTQLVHRFCFCFVFYFTFDPLTHPIPSFHPPTHLLSSLHFFWVGPQWENTIKESWLGWLAGWLAGFFRGWVVYTCSLLFKKAEKKVRYCSSSSSSSSSTSSLSVKNAEDVVTTSPTSKKSFLGERESSHGVGVT